MKKSGILHPRINLLLASSGHTDYFTISDRGFPVPDGPERIDLALADNLPTVLDVLRLIQAEFAIDRIVGAEEMTKAIPQRLEDLRRLLGETPIETMPHLELKQLAASGKATI